MSDRTAYLLVPGPSITTILCNIPCILKLSDETPIILMDVYDYNRLWEETLRDGEDSQKAPYLLMAFNDLCRRGIVRLIDYSAFYPAEDQQYYLDQNRALLEDTPDWVNQKAAVQASDEWIKYGRGEHQEWLRAGLGEDVDGFSSLRQEEERLHEKLDQGLGDPKGWNEKVLNKDVAALEVRRRADDVLNLNICGVITGLEHKITGGLFDAARPQPGVRPAPDFLDTGFNIINTDTSHLNRLEPNEYIIGLDPNDISQTHNVFKKINKRATDIVDGQPGHWVILGPRLALPRYKNISEFEFDIAKEEINSGLDVEQLTEEVLQAKSVLRRRTEKGLPANKLSYQAEHIVEQYNRPVSQSKVQHKGIAGMIGHTSDLSRYSIEIQSMLKQGVISQATAFLLLSIMSDPTRRYHENDVHRRAINLITRFNPSPYIGMNPKEVRKGRRSVTWGERIDWFEAEINNRIR